MDKSIQDTIEIIATLGELAPARKGKMPTELVEQREKQRREGKKKQQQRERANSNRQKLSEFAEEAEEQQQFNYVAPQTIKRIYGIPDGTVAKSPNTSIAAIGMHRDWQCLTCRLNLSFFD